MNDLGNGVDLLPSDVSVTEYADQNGSNQGNDEVGHGVRVARLHRSVRGEHEIDQKFIDLPQHGERQGSADRQESGEEWGRLKIDAREENQEKDEDNQGNAHAGHSVQDEIPPPKRVIEIRDLSQDQSRAHEEHDPHSQFIRRVYAKKSF